MSKSRALLVTMISVIASAAVLALIGPSVVWLRVIVAVPFILLLPGHSLMLIVDPEGRLGTVEWFVLSVAASISIVMLLAMTLAYLPSGLSFGGVLTAITVVTLLLGAVAYGAADSREWKSPSRSASNSLRQAALGALALLTCVLIVTVVSIPSAVDASAGRVVQLWGIPEPTGGLRVGVTNVNAPSKNYRLVIEQDRHVVSEQELVLPAGSSRIFEVRQSALKTTDSPVTAVLTDDSGLVSRRTISVWPGR